MKKITQYLATGLACLALASFSAPEARANPYEDMSLPNSQWIQALEAYSRAVELTASNESFKLLYDFDNDGTPEFLKPIYNGYELWDYVNKETTVQTFHDLTQYDHPAMENGTYHLGMGGYGVDIIPMADGTTTLRHIFDSYVFNMTGEPEDPDSYFASVTYLSVEGGTIVRTNLEKCTNFGTTTYYINQEVVSQGVFQAKESQLEGNGTPVQVGGLHFWDNDVQNEHLHRHLSEWGSDYQLYYPDVLWESWYFDAVVFMSYYSGGRYSKTDGIMYAEDGDNFLPNANASRGMIAEVMLNAEPMFAYNFGSTNFADAYDTKYDYAIRYVRNEGIMSGYSSDYFGVFDDVTRQEFALILYNEYKDYSTFVSGNASHLAQFGDSGAVADWAKDGIAWCVANGILAGSEGNINPTASVTRAQVAVMVQKAIITSGKYPMQFYQ